MHGFKTSVLDFARVTNESMLPHLKPHQLLVIAKYSPCIKNPVTGGALFCRACEPGSAYVFADPRAPQRKLVKFALDRAREKPGENPPLSFLQAPPLLLGNWFTQGIRNGLEPAHAGISCYFEGSNRRESVDSRHFGRVPVSKIYGRVIYPRVFWNGVD